MQKINLRMKFDPHIDFNDKSFRIPLMKKRFVFILLVLTVSFCPAALAYERVPSVQGYFVADVKDQSLSTGTEVSLAFVVKATANIENLEVLIELPSGVSLIDGETHKNFRHIKNKTEIALRFRVRLIATTPQTIKAVVNLVDEPSEQFGYTESFIYVLNQKSLPKPVYEKEKVQ